MLRFYETLCPMLSAGTAGFGLRLPERLEANQERADTPQQRTTDIPARQQPENLENSVAEYHGVNQVFQLFKVRWDTIFFLSCLLITGCSCERKAPGLEIVEQKNEFGHLVKIQRRIADGARQGPYLRMNAQGVVLEEAFYQQDTLDGPRVLYYDDGDTLSVETYDMGTFQGAFRQYYDNGQLQLQGMYLDNEMTGKWRQYYENGQLMEVVTFESNQENGPFTEYHPNGALKAEGNYLNGDYEHGLLKLYDEQGELIRKMNCQKGVCRTIWRADNAEDS